MKGRVDLHLRWEESPIPSTSPMHHVLTKFNPENNLIICIFFDSNYFLIWLLWAILVFGCHSKPNDKVQKQSMCIFDKVFASFWYSIDKNVHKNKMHVNWHAQFRFRHVVWLAKKETTRQLTLYKLKRHVLLDMWHWGDILEENVDVKWHSFLFLKTSHDTLDLKLNVKWNLSNILITGSNDILCREGHPTLSTPNLPNDGASRHHIIPNLQSFYLLAFVSSAMSNPGGETCHEFHSKTFQKVCQR